jgi:folate-binding Fe-S cluster repair protein YgfZ
MKGYEALRGGAAWIDLSGRGHILVHGEDRKRLLHAMTTNHVEQLQAGQGCYAFFLNDKGRILADVNILARPEFLILDTEPETGALILEHLDKYIIADDVTLEDRSGSVAILGVEGPRAAEILRARGAPEVSGNTATAAWGDRLVAVLSATGGPGFRIFAPAEQKETIAAGLEKAGAV